MGRVLQPVETMQGVPTGSKHGGQGNKVVFDPLTQPLWGKGWLTD